MRESSLLSVYPEEGPSLAAAGVDDVTPSLKDRTMDARGLRFDWTMVVAIVGTAIGVVTAQQLSQAGMKSDMRDILTRMEYQAKVDAADARAQDVLYENMSKSLDSLRAQVQLLQLQYAELNKQMTQKGR